MLFYRTIKDMLALTSGRFFNILRLSRRSIVMPNIVIYPTSFCNYDCEMCISGRSTAEKKEYISIDMLKNVLADSVRSFPKKEVHFSGYGEPLVYPHIREALQLCRELELTCSMTTNGYLLEKHIDTLIENRCYALNISIHGDSVLHDKVTGTPGSFQKTITAVRNLDNRRKQLKSKTPLVAVNHVITRSNVSSLRQDLDLLLSLPVNGINFQHLIFSRDDLENRRDFLITGDRELEMLGDFIDYVQNTRFPVPVRFFPRISRNNLERYYKNTQPDFPPDCILPWLSVRVYPDGSVKQCNVVFGNLHDSSLRHIINNEKAQRFRDMVRKGKFDGKLCFRCCQRRYSHQDV